MDYFDPVLNGAVVYVAGIPFWYSEKDSLYTEVIDNPTGSIFLATG